MRWWPFMPEAETTRTTMRPRAQAARRTAGCYSERCLDWPRRQPLDVSTYRVHQRCLHNVLACMCVADGGNMHRYLHIYIHITLHSIFQALLCMCGYVDTRGLRSVPSSPTLFLSPLLSHFYDSTFTHAVYSPHLYIYIHTYPTQRDHRRRRPPVVTAIHSPAAHLAVKNSRTRVS